LCALIDFFVEKALIFKTFLIYESRVYLQTCTLEFGSLSFPL